MQHCDTFLGTLFLSPHTERQRPSQRWFRMRLAWWISLLSLFIDHWVTRAVASADKPTLLSWWLRNLRCGSPLLGLQAVTLQRAMPVSQQFGFADTVLTHRPSWVSWASSVLASPRRDVSVWGKGCTACRINTSPWPFLRESKFLRNSEVDQWGLYDYGCNIFELTVANVSHQY